MYLLAVVRRLNVLGTSRRAGRFRVTAKILVSMGLWLGISQAQTFPIPLKTESSRHHTQDVAGQAQSISATTLSACQQITMPGVYVLSNDLVMPSSSLSACFLFFNTGADTTTTLDCQGHSITNTSTVIANMLIADTVPNFEMTNCVLNVTTPANSGVQILRSPGAVLLNNVISNTSVFIGDSDNTTFEQNSISLGGLSLVPIEQSTLSGVTVDSNTIDLSQSTQLNSGIQADQLVDSIITNNKVYGSQSNTDDDIVLGDSGGVIIAGNTLIGAFDVGIEFYGFNDHIEILENTMNNVSRGIGGWWDLSMTNSVIDGNVVSNATLFDFNYSHENTNPSTYTVTFSGNQISNNTVSDGCAGPCGGPSAFFDFTEDLADNPVQPLPHTSIANNILANNNFDLNTWGPHLNPPAGFIDEGGNVCSTTGIFPSVGYPIHCRTSLPCTTLGSGQFHACYWPNESWSGTEEVNRMESYPISLNWGGGAPSCASNLPVLGQSCPNNMSGSWTGSFQFNSGYYSFTVRAGGGTVTAFVDGAQVFSHYYAELFAYSNPFTLLLSSGAHTVTLTFASNGFWGYSDAELSWAAL